MPKCFGSDATVGGLKFQFSNRNKADVKTINDARKAGINGKDITLGGGMANGNGQKAALLPSFAADVLHSTFSFVKTPPSRTAY